VVHRKISEQNEATFQVSKLMCGIVGQFSYSPQPFEAKENVTRLTSLMHRRGPDDQGYWSDGLHCALGFRRLSILDLTPTGRQPMRTPDGRYTIVINGELYNFTELRHELQSKGWRFRSTGDAEVALFALAEWGKTALERFNGMFALAFYDRQEKRLLLARDHVGSKPLYYLQVKQGMVFGSQYDQIMAHPWAKRLPINQGSLALYLRFGYIPAPYAILENTHMVEAGCWLEINAQGEILQGRYFDFPIYQEPDLFGEEAYQSVNDALVNAVQRQMVSDVPLGSFLSGGVDSPLICAIAQSLNPRPIKAFTMGVPGSPMDESGEAVRYANQIGVDHQVKIIRFDHVQDLAQEVTAACSEPFGDYSIFPTLIVSKFASQQVKVMLSGDGGDELFWGYTGRMGNAIRYAHLFKWPFFARKLRWWLLRRPGEWNTRYFQTPGEWYRSQHEHNFEGWLKMFFPDIVPFPEDYNQYQYNSGETNFTAQWVRWNEFTGHMGNGLLKVDRGSMYNALEVRAPLLDREVIATAQRVDWRTCLNIEENYGKLPLRSALEKQVGFVTEGKHGFTVPMGDWLRGPLRPMFEDLVLNNVDLLGLFIQRDRLFEVYKAHLNGQHNREWGLWIILSLALWQQEHYQRWLT
jgi:asparagine synthase (glutamine-hydrolysing)